MTIQGKRIFITGGCGFIGTSIAARLAHDNEIILYDNERRNAIQHTSLLDLPSVTFIHGDILDREHLAHSLTDVDIIFHCGAITGASSYAVIPIETLQTNIIGTFNVLDCARNIKLEKLVNFSSSEVYGTEAENVHEEDPLVVEPISDLRWSYAISKIAAESFALGFVEKYAVPVISVRPCNIYGPYQVGEGAIHNIIEQSLHDEPITIYGTGEQTRSWCFIDDFTTALFLLAQSRITGQVFNIGNYNEYYTINYLARKIIELTGSSSYIKHEPLTYADVNRRRPDVTKLRKYVDFIPNISLDEGLSRTIDWYRSLLR